VAVLYNRLVRARVRVDEAWAQVAAQLQRRHDLVPGLVTVVRAYASHEDAALTAVTAARAAALRTREPVSRAAAEDRLGDALGGLLALTERYPELRADARFADLARELSGTEDRIAFARGFANDRVRRYHELLDTFPSVVVARLFRFGRAASFTTESPEARPAPAIDLTGGGS
jgi:LemA protein